MKLRDILTNIGAQFIPVSTVEQTDVIWVNLEDTENWENIVTYVDNITDEQYLANPNLERLIQDIGKVKVQSNIWEGYEDYVHLRALDNFEHIEEEWFSYIRNSYNYGE